MPSVEQSRTNEQGPKAQYGFVLDLTGSDPLKIDVFDEEAKKVDIGSTSSYYRIRMSHLKFVVVDDKMLLFAGWREHKSGMTWMKELFPEVNTDGKIQCAGHIRVTIGPSGYTRDRNLYGESEAFTAEGTLSWEDSEEYKHIVLQEKLGEHFLIE